MLIADRMSRSSDLVIHFHAFKRHCTTVHDHSFGIDGLNVHYNFGIDGLNVRYSFGIDGLNVHYSFGIDGLNVHGK